MDKHDRYELQKANSLVNWSFALVFLPIVSWVLVTIASNKLKVLASEYPENNLVNRTRKKLVSSVVVSVSVVILSTIGGVWFSQWYTSTLQREREATTQQQLEVERNQQNAEQFRLQHLQEQLTACIDGVNEWQKQNSQGYHTDEYWQNIIQIRQQYTDDCKAKYPVN